MVSRWLVHALLLFTFCGDFSCFLSPPISIAIEIGFTLPRINHSEGLRQFETLINKSLVSEQTFFLRIQTTTHLSGAGQRATLGEDFQTAEPYLSRRMDPKENSILLSYLIYDDLTPENQEVFQLYITPDISSPPFGCSVTSGCYQQIEVVIIDNDGGL